ncbi:MAG: ATP-binding protein [Desulfuromonadales bacterium]
MIQDLLYYCDIILQDSQRKTSREDLKEIINTLANAKRPTLGQNKQILRTELTGDWPLFSVDRRRIELALGAILDTAIKFTHPGGEISLTGVLSERELSLTISDNGPGIAPEERGKIFEKFYQIDPHNKGTTVTIRLPRPSISAS